MRKDSSNKSRSASKVLVDKKVVFFILMGFGLLFSFINVVMSHGRALDFFLFVDRSDSFMDFFNCIFHAFDANPYIAGDRIYPAVCYILYWFLSLFIPREVLEQGGKAIRSNQQGMFVFIVCVVLVTWLFISMMKGLFHERAICNIILISLLILSGPFLYQFERANLIIVALVFSGWFLLYKDSPNPYVRCFACFSLAFASCLKIYPALLGLILLKERRWKEVLQCIVFGLVLFVLPFAVMGGFGSIKIWANSLFQGAANTLNMSQGLGYKVNYSSVLTSLIVLLKHRLAEHYFTYGNYGAYLLSAVAFIAACLSSVRWKTVALICCIIIGLPGFSFQYAMIFMVLPLAAFFAEEKNKPIDYVYAFLFAFQFMLLIPNNNRFELLFPGDYPLSFMVFLEGVSVALMTGILSIDVFVCLIRRLRRPDVSSGD